MNPSKAPSAGSESGELHHRHEEPLARSYECVLCGTHWGYGVIQNTARCPACGGGLIRDAADLPPG